MNNLGESIVFHNCDSRDADIGEKADAVVSELIGHMVFEEGMVESLFDAKKRFLKEGGSLIPQTVTLFAAPVCERKVYASSIDRWKSAYGIDYSIMREHALTNTYLTEIDERDLLATHEPVFSVDFESSRHPEVHARRKFKVHRSGQLNGVALWFDSTLATEIRLSSGPWTKTHWKQCFTPIPNPMDVKAGAEVSILFDMTFRSRAHDRFVFGVTVEGTGV